MGKTQKEIILEMVDKWKKRGIGTYSNQLRGKKIMLHDLLIFDGLYDPDKIKKEDFLEGEGMSITRSPLIIDFCNVIYASSWYKDNVFDWHKWEPRLDYFKNIDLIKEAPIEDIYKMLIVIVRMEHWNNGFVYRAAKRGRISAILYRIKVGELY